MQELINHCKRRAATVRLRLKIALLVRTLMKQARTTPEPIQLRELGELDVLRRRAHDVSPCIVEYEVLRIQKSLRRSS